MRKSVTYGVLLVTNMAESSDDSGTDSLARQLAGQRVAVPESRQLDVLAKLLERRSAEVLRLPLVSIRDVSDPVPVNAWLRDFMAQPPDYFVILTGEGLRRLHGFARALDRADNFERALRQVCKVCRGPKPGKALRELGMKPDLLGSEPTTAGIITTLEQQPLDRKRVGVQLYGEEPNHRLMDFLARSGALASAVAPYVYASDLDERQVVDFIHELARRRVTAITFTSQPQYNRLESVARRHGLEEELVDGLNRIIVVAVGPLMGQRLREAEVGVQVMPDSSWFMKPMVSALVKSLHSMDRTQGSTGNNEP